MNRHFRFNFKSFGKDRKCLDKHGGKSTIAGHDVLDVMAVFAPEHIDEAADDHIS